MKFEELIKVIPAHQLIDIFIDGHVVARGPADDSISKVYLRKQVALVHASIFGNGRLQINLYKDE